MFRHSTLDHGLTHLQELFEFQPLALPHIRVVVGGLYHQQHIEVLVGFCVILKTVHFFKPFGDIANDPFHLLGFLGKGERVEDQSHGLVHWEVFKGKRGKEFLANLAHLIGIHAKVLSDQGLFELKRLDGARWIRRYVSVLGILLDY